MMRHFPARAKSGPPKAAACGAMALNMKPVFLKSRNVYFPFPNYFRKGNNQNSAILNFPVRAL
jgi:hypothetical protein